MSQRATKHESGEQVGHKESGQHRVARPASEPREQASVQQYFDRYAKAMTSGDIKAMARLWGVPAFIVGASEARVVESESEVEQFFEEAKAMYRKRGIVDTRPDIVNLDWVGDDLVIATVRWPYSDDNDATVGEESASYTLLRGEDGGFKVRAITLRGSCGIEASSATV